MQAATMNSATVWRALRRGGGGGDAAADVANVPVAVVGEALGGDDGWG